MGITRHDTEMHGLREPDEVLRSTTLATPQFIREDLTRTRSQIAYEARKLKRTGVIKDTWVFDGKIFLKQLNDNTTVCSDIASLPCRAVDDN